MKSPNLIFHHVGIASSSIESDEKNYADLGYVREGDVFVDNNQKIKGLFMTLGEVRIEIVEPTVEDSPVNTFINRGTKIYHQAFTSSDLLATIKVLELQGAMVVVEPVSAVAFGGRKISFLMLKNKTLIELIERSTEIISGIPCH